jgi:2-oxoisovalerate dehydrogenase E1 component beta subunit
MSQLRAVNAGKADAGEPNPGRSGAEKSGTDKTGGKTMVEAIRDALLEEMTRDDSVVVLGEDVALKGGVFKATDGLLERFGPWRVLDTPISEAAIAGAAIGAAMVGLRPVAEFEFADYMHPAYDQLVNQAATMRWRTVGRFHVPAVFRAPIGAGVRGGIYHSQSVEALYCHIPGLKVVVPGGPADAKGLLKAAIRDDDPVVFFESKRLYRSSRELIPEDPEWLLPLGRAAVARAGNDLTVLTYGMGLNHSLEAAKLLAEEGTEAEVIDIRTLVPLDRETIATSVRKTGRVLVVHEANKTLGFGAEIVAFIAEELFGELDAPVTRVAADDCHLAFNASEEDAVIPNVASVVVALKKLARF